ncbi:MAG TPA: FGGY family carbohydrate kinase [Nitrospiria bacterium]|nr:FGGY family carbohydrate kinase [Nitrospiria bacterium]
MRRMADYLLGLDQGSTNSKAVLVDRKGRIVRLASAPLKTVRPRSGWVEHDPKAILNSQLQAVKQLIRSAGRKNSVVALGIANQRSTIIIWDKDSGRPLTPAISWQDLRAAEIMQQWSDHRELIRSKTGLMLTPYYAAPKLRWLLDRSKGLRAKAEKGSVLCGTVNTFLIWHLTNGEVHATDHTNAARTLLMNLHSLSWDDELLSLFGIPPVILPRIHPTASDYGTARFGGAEIPIRASIGDQQAGLLGLGAVDVGEAVVNYGTGGFLLVNTGSQAVPLPGLLTSLAWTTPGETAYVSEGTVNAVGTLFDWVQKMGWIKSVDEIDRVLKTSNERVYLVPALAGLGAPHWLSHARTAVLGLGPTTTKADLVRASVEGVAFLVKDIAEAFRKTRSIRIKTVTAGGGGSRIASMVQTQADLLGIPILRSGVTEATALGAALLAGVGSDWWNSPSAVPKIQTGTIFRPRISEAEREKIYGGWKKAIEAVKVFSGD